MHVAERRQILALARPQDAPGPTRFDRDRVRVLGDAEDQKRPDAIARQRRDSMPDDFVFAHDVLLPRRVRSRSTGGDSLANLVSNSSTQLFDPRLIIGVLFGDRRVAAV